MPLFDPSTLVGLAQEYQNDTDFQAQYNNRKQPFERRENLLLRHGQICVPKGEFRLKLLHDHHCTPNTGHLGITKTINRIKPKYYWKALRSDIIRYVKSCECQMSKASNQKPAGLLQPLDPPDTQWTHITMDFVTPLPQSSQGHNEIFVVVDRLSKMVRIVPLKPNLNALKIAQLFKDNIYRPHGIPLNIISDRDPIFLSKFWKELFRLLGTKLSPSSSFHPQTDRQSEILNRKKRRNDNIFRQLRQNQLGPVLGRFRSGLQFFSSCHHHIYAFLLELRDSSKDNALRFDPSR